MAHYYVGNAYLQGTGVQKNEKLAFPYLQHAAHEGSMSAQFVLGGCYDHGKGLRSLPCSLHSNFLKWTAFFEACPFMARACPQSLFFLSVDQVEGLETTRTSSTGSKILIIWLKPRGRALDSRVHAHVIFYSFFSFCFLALTSCWLLIFLF